jgi:phage terminase small subunit
VYQISPALTVFEKLSKTVMSLGSKLGLSPADREKLASFARIEKEEADPYETLKAGAK